MTEWSVSGTAAPTTKELFEWQATWFLHSNLGRQTDVDRLYELLPLHGKPTRSVPLCVFRRFSPGELAELMRLVVVNGTSGRSRLEPTSLSDENWVPHGPHILMNVKDGLDRLGQGPRKNYAHLKCLGHRGFAAVHLVLMGVYYGAGVLENYSWDALGSRYARWLYPFIQVKDGHAELNAYSGLYLSSNRGSPSAKEVLVV